MKKHAIGIAALSALSIDDDGWCQLLPAGHFSARDGRPFDVTDGQGGSSTVRLPGVWLKAFARSTRTC